MHDHADLLTQRLDRFVRDHLAPHLYRERRPLTLSAWSVPDEPVPFAEAAGQTYQPIQTGTRWGRAWSTLWLRVQGAVPPSWRDVPGTRVEIDIDLGFTGGPGFNAEGLAWRPDGSIIKAISPDNRWLPIEGDEIDFYLEAAANPDVGAAMAGGSFRPTPLGDKATAGDDPLYELRIVDVALLDVEVWELLGDIWTLRGLMGELGGDDARRHEILLALSRMVDVVDPTDVAGTATEGRKQLASVLDAPASASAHRMVAVGHAHIDSAWLWPLRETVRKVARTWSNVADLADTNPDFVFACSSAQQYAWMKQYYPALFERIRGLVARGQFAPVGGMWVESDTNMPGGEAMARQFVAGKQFFLDEFGVETEEVWLPDSFGYSAALPQIVAASASRWFLTQKISWNQTNTMPHHTFAWEGIDGSRVFTHFPPADTYNSVISGAELARASRQYAEKGAANLSLLPFGHGDGGGGPTREMIAAAHRTADLDGSARVELSSPRRFFERAEDEYGHAPVWRGEMYLELHRGTLTSQLKTKQGNRRNEHLLREAELYAATAAARTGFAYPYERLAELWELLLLHQFHDILPGSSIAWVHHDAERNHAAITAGATEIVNAALAALTGAGEAEVAVNAGPHLRDGVPALGGLLAADLPSVTPTTVEADAEDVVLDNGIVRAVVNRAGQLVSLIDHSTGREAISPDEPANRLRLHRDEPANWDAWDIDEYYRRTVTELDEVDSFSIDEDAGAVSTERRTPTGSLIRQRLVLRPGSPAVDIEHEIDWRERQKLLKLGFGFDVHAENVAAETQFGHLYRPTHTNTSWEDAKFETCAHRFVHVGEPGYGVAVTNDSTYGFDAQRTTRDDGGTTTTVNLSLIRAPQYPDPDADQGLHTLQVAVRPGATVGDAVEQGYRTNLPARTVRGGQGFTPLLVVDNPAVVVESVKLAGDKSGDVVVRLYESRGARAEAAVSLTDGATSVVATDLLERTGTSGVRGCGDLVGGVAHLRLRPFQLVTLRFTR
ncbi:MAG TPA: glycoside hydrolase family 38 C-terminal domain-containing protein [Microlunatus sp.]|nr:glycoside hydrolase family 38 C-terminal domain-containing protein [Microlunatus sp.]